MTSFPTPKVYVNYTHWGPINLPEKYLDVPYAPFGKGDRLGKCADFTSFGQYGNYRYQRNNKNNQDSSNVNSEFQYRHDVSEDASFQLVDTVKSNRSRLRPFQVRPVRQNYNRQNRVVSNTNPGAGRVHTGQQQNKRWDRLQKKRYANHRGQEKKVEREASVNILPTWNVVQQFDLNQLTKMQTTPPEPEDLKWCGYLKEYDEIYDRISSRSEKPLTRFSDREFYYVTTTDDPVIQEMATEGVGNVFATDAILSHLMSCTRSVHPWDIVVQRIGSSLFFDKRDASDFDLLTVNETAINVTVDDNSESINYPEKLSIEATMINQNFSQQVLKDNQKTFDYPNPFVSEGTDPAGYAYRYRMWDLGDNINLVARCELHAFCSKRGDEQLITTYALNEWDSKISGGVEWRQKIDAQRGAVLATELKNNSNKLSKWTAQAIIAGADQMKLGYVSRATRNDPYSHVVLGTHTYKPRDFAAQIALNVNNMWGIIKSLVDFFMQQPEGKYLILKDPNKPMVRIYSVPPETFEDEESDE